MKYLNELLNKINKKDLLFFSGLYILILYFFSYAFNMKLMTDDYTFYHISQAHNLKEFLYFFYPFKNLFYRPIPTELFYFILRLSGANFVFGHIIVFTTYFIGLFFLFKISFKILKSRLFSYLVVFMYGISFIHVFQLYMFNTFQEICLFTFFAISFYMYIQKRIRLSILFFIFALLSKETAALFPALIIAYEIYLNRKIRFNFKKILPFILLSAVFTFLYRSGINSVQQIDIYKVHLSPQLIINNSVWYSLWSVGVPNFIPNYMKSVLLKPLPIFWEILKSDSIRNYLYELVAYLFIFFSTLLLYVVNKRKEIKKNAILIIGSVFLFFLFIAPTLPIIHRWMVRLTIPLIFIIFIQAFIIFNSYISKNIILKVLSIMLIVIYIHLNIQGIKMHEYSGLFVSQNQIFLNSQREYQKHGNEIIRTGSIYFIDPDGDYIGGSKALKQNYHDQDFLSYFFPNSHVKAIYAFENKEIPAHAFIIKAKDLVN